MRITVDQAQILLFWMAQAASDAAEDERFGETWRLERFQEQAKTLFQQFNELEPEE